MLRYLNYSGQRFDQIHHPTYYRVAVAMDVWRDASHWTRKQIDKKKTKDNKN